MEYLPTIGLEIHAQLNTRTKMFCDCKNDPDEERPNINICPICLGHPGTLPVINKEAVRSILKIGIAVGGESAKRSEFDRKNYFYPDIPKGYQLSQYKHPLVLGGELAGIQITRVHLEEDTGTSVHGDTDHSLVNFNRSGVPLMELVTEPVIHSSSEASKFAKELQLLLQYLGVAEANMEKGEMRVEANVSVSQKTNVQSQKLGTKVEIKNLNSFKAAEKAIEYEIKRQTEILGKGQKVMQETRGWDEKKEMTFSQRQKEESHDYRYFPDPDLPKLDISKVVDFNNLEIDETPHQKRLRFKEKYEVKESDIEFYVNNRELSNFFERVAKTGEREFNQLASNYVISDLASMGHDYKRIKPEYFGELILMLNKSKVSSRGAKNILAEMVKNEQRPGEIALKNNLLQQSNEREIEKIVDEVIAANEKVVIEYKGGKRTSLQYLIGQGIKVSKGSANPGVLKKLFEKKLG